MFPQFSTNQQDPQQFNALNFARPIQQKQAMNALAGLMNDPAKTTPKATLAGGLAGGGVGGNPAPMNTKGQVQYNAAAGDDDVARGIIDAATELGVDPLDLATAISYETGGTFDPVKRGPTTQWGQHRGLIQFGEPQARQYGVDWSDPVGSQLGAGGAVVSYLRSNGVQPGMGLLDIYSTINAGAPGLYGRSDANNGGAPGTVRDKVEQQMGGHRRKAEQMLAPYASQRGIAARADTLAALGL